MKLIPTHPTSPDSPSSTKRTSDPAAKLYRLLMDYSLRIMGTKQYSVKELTSKMRLKLKRLEKYDTPKTRALLAANTEAAIESVLARLTEWKYLSDSKIIESALDSAVNYKPQGRNAFLVSMLKKGISKDSAKTAWESKRIDERELAVKVLKKYLPKYKGLEKMDRKRKLAGVLARKGFSGDVVWSTLEQFVD